MNGIICIYKPKNFTSFDVVAKLRGVFKTKKIGHSGTLDPMATGVLPVFVGKATKAISLIPDTDKRYIAKFMLGQTTDTQDVTGNILKSTVSNFSKSDIDNILSKYIGKIKQIPPMYSAVKKGGVPLYKLARKGYIVNREAREVEIYNISCNFFDEDTQTGILDVSCSSGTYIRTICNDMGADLGVGGVLKELVRTAACGYELEDCYSLDEICAIKDLNELKGKLKSVESLFESFDKLQLDGAQETMFRNGVKLDVDQLPHIDGKVAVYGDSFLGIAHPEGKELKIDKLLV
ncbi:MAG: tRNA pseudouridine(55) synthase TruB [Oscillospiraceae bacterium]|nr:tRNA pseudouridine(55) synthase TruB [Oscillospiraceae bacterium]